MVNWERVLERGDEDRVLKRGSVERGHVVNWERVLKRGSRGQLGAGT